MDSKVLIDTNILIYAIDASSPFHEKSLEVLQNAENGIIQAFIAEKSLYELAAVLSSQAFVNKIKLDQIREHILYFADNSTFSLLHSTDQITNTIWRLFFNLNSRKNRIYDLVLAATAIEYGINTIYTKNVKDFEQIKELQIVDPTS
jgi:predicted nucleic acid-binding protein